MKIKLSIAELKKISSNLDIYLNFIYSIMNRQRLVSESRYNKIKIIETNIKYIKNTIDNNPAVKLALNKIQVIKIDKTLEEAEAWMKDGT